MANEVDVRKSEFQVMNMKQSDLQEMFDVNLQGETISQGDLEKITMPSGKTHVWTIPTLEGEDNPKEFVGIIAAWKNARTYWSRTLEESGGGEEPDCRSSDGKKGIGNPGGLCEDCALSQWGEEGQPPKCTEQRMVFIVYADNILPYMLIVPPTSIKAVRRYLLRLSGRGVKHYGVKTRFALEPATNPKGIDYAKIKLESAGTLSPEDTAKMAVYNNNITTLVAGTHVAPEEEVDFDSDSIDYDSIKEDEEVDLKTGEVSKKEKGLPLKEKAPPEPPPLDDEDDDTPMDAFICMDKFIEEEDADFTFFYVALKELGKTRSEAHRFFKVESLKEVEKEKLNKYLEAVYKNKFGEGRYD